MQNLKNKINNLLLARKQHRKAAAAIAVLSLFVIVGVCASLTVPAVSYAGTDAGGTGYPYENPPENAYLFKPDIVDVSATQQEDGPGSDGAVSVAFSLSYTIDNTTLANGNYIYYNLNTDREDSTGAKIVIPSGGLPAGGGLGDVTMGGVNVGTYRIEEDGLVVIRFFDDYRNNTALQLEEGTTQTGTLSFTAGVQAAAGDDSDDITLDFGGDGSTSASVVITGFVYSNVELEKTAPPQLNADRTLEWTIKVSNPDNADLGGLVITDEQFAGAKEGSVLCSAGEVVTGTDSEGNEVVTVVLDSTTDSEVTITYTTEVSESDYSILLNGGSVNNTAVISRPDGKELDSASAGLQVSAMITSDKQGSISYGKDSDEITWTITIRNSQGLDLGGYYLVDDRFSSLTADDITSNAAFSLEGGNLVFASGTTETEITVSFTQTTDKSTASDADYKNTAWLYAPDKNTNRYNYTEVQRYQVSAGKSGQVVAGQPMIDWSVTVYDRLPDDDVSFDDLLISDDMLLNLLNSLSEDEWENAVTVTGSGSSVPFEIVKDDGGKAIGVKVSENFDASQLAPDWQGFTSITFSYRTDAVVEGFSEELEPGEYKTVNHAGISGIGTAEHIEITDITATVIYTKRAEVAKSHGDAKLSDDRQSLVVPWTIQIDGEEGTFEAMVLVDTMNASSGNTELAHTFKGLTKVYAATAAGGRDLSETEYTLTLTENGFQIALNEEVLGQDFVDSIIAMTIAYESQVSLEDSALNTGDIVHYKNTVSVIDKEASAEGEYTLVNQDDRLQKESLYGSTELTLDELETATVNGVECYLFRWKLTLNENGEYSGMSPVKITDTLPEGFRLYEEADQSTGFYGQYSNGTKESFTNNVNSWLGYQTEDTDGRQAVTFGMQVFGNGSKDVFSVFYVTYIPKADLDTMVGSSGYTVVNEASDGEVSKNAELNISSGNVVIPENDGVVTKTASPQTSGGYISYTVDFNPEALDLIDGGDSIILQDKLDFGSSYYTVENMAKGELVNESPAGLLNVSLNSISFYEIDEDGNRTLLDPQPTYVFENALKNTVTESVAYAETEENFSGQPQHYPYYHYYKFSNVKNGSTLTVRVVDIGGSAFIDSGGSTAYTSYGNLDYVLSKVDDATYEYTISVNADTDSDKIDVYLGWANWDSATDGASLPDSVATAVAEYHEKVADALLTMTVPDGKHIEIEYQYKALSEEVYSVPHMENSITAVSKYASHGDSEWVEYQAYNDSAATVSSDLTIEKTDASNSGQKLSAGFQLLRYNASVGAWEYAQGIEKQNGKTVVSSWSVDSPEEYVTGLIDTAVSKAAPFTISLDGSYLYYLEEVRWPEGYDENFSDNKYFVYNSKIDDVTVPSEGPGGEVIQRDEILTLLTDSTLSLKNRKADIAVSAVKTWADGNENHTEDVCFELWSSPTLSVSATELPSDAVLVYEKVVVSANNGSWTYTWDNLPSTDEEGRVIYYYVKEVDCTGDYSPLYIGNGLNDTGTVEVMNSKGITLTKEWFYDNGDPIPDSELPDQIQVKLYRATELSAELPEGAELIQPSADTEYYIVYKAKDWTLDITGLAKSDAEGNDYYYYVEEVSVEGYETEYQTNGSMYNGILVVRNTKESGTGITLPSAGGNGTAQFIGFGAFLMIFAGAALILIKRKSVAVNDKK